MSYDLTAEELLSLDLAESEHNYKVRLVYFAMQRCLWCSDRRSCDTHAQIMTHVDDYDKDNLASAVYFESTTYCDIPAWHAAHQDHLFSKFKN